MDVWLPARVLPADRLLLRSGTELARSSGGRLSDATRP
jgi:hypothetical protein